MIGTFTEHGPYLTETVNLSRRVGQQFGNPLTALTMLPPFPGASHQFVFTVLKNTTDTILLFAQ